MGEDPDSVERQQKYAIQREVLNKTCPVCGRPVDTKKWTYDDKRRGTQDSCWKLLHEQPMMAVVAAWVSRGVIGGEKDGHGDSITVEAAGLYMDLMLKRMYPEDYEDNTDGSE